MSTRDIDILMQMIQHLEDKVDHLQESVEKIKVRATFWGAVTGALTAAALSGFGWGCGSQLPVEYGSVPSQVEAVLAETVVLYDGEGNIRCAGVEVEFRVVTAAHCVDPGETVYMSRIGSPDFVYSTPVSLFYSDAVNDIAVLDSYTDSTSLRLAEENPGLGEDLWVCGHPYGLAWSVTQGRMVAIRHTQTIADTSTAWFQVDITVAPGNSGGPLVNADGELVGITSFKWGPIAGFVPLDTVRRALTEERNAR